MGIYDQIKQLEFENGIGVAPGKRQKYLPGKDTVTFI